jgi:hypothetical protein
VRLLVFHAYINEITVQEVKFPVKNLVTQRCAEGFNSGVIGLIMTMQELIMIMEGSKTLFCSSKFPWTLKRISSQYTGNLVT